ncbi:MAG: hypothetical protein LBK61_00985 [Spirochaetaceae bacterium]|jgi:hypothetical protein|nr:hypothetical protein [Spirochaetaceae bacterium]
MKKSGFRGTIGMAAVAAMVCGFLVAGCGSSPKAAPTINADAGTLTGKTAVIIPLTLAERKSPEGSDTTMTGLLGVAQSKAVASEWVKAFNDVAKRNEAETAKKTKEAYEAFAEAYKTEYNATLVEAAFDFGKNAPPLTFFGKPDKKTVSAIAQLCAENNADYAITLLYRITDGSVVTTVTSQNASVLTAVIAVFDKTGKIVALKEGQTPSETFRFIYVKGTATEDEFNSGLNQSLLNLYDNLKNVVAGFAKGIAAP